MNEFRLQPVNDPGAAWLRPANADGIPFLNSIRTFVVASLFWISGCVAHAAESTTAVATTGSIPAFVDGDVVCFVGDSITHGGLWHRYVECFYATRYPQRSIRFINCGISGDYAGGVLARLDTDVLCHRPTVAVVMLGMNDVGRDSYRQKAGVDDQALKKRADAILTYRKSLLLLTKRLQQSGVSRVVLVTPSPYDETALFPSESHRGVNAALAQCSEIVKECARDCACELVDLHGPMTALNLQLQNKDPQSSVVGPDRVHPRAPGHLVMAACFLRTQSIQPLVSKVSLNSRSCQTISTENCTVDQLSCEQQRIEFRCTGTSLPWPIEDDARPALDWIKEVDSLNEESISISDLPQGDYEVVIDGTGAWTGKSSELALGIELGHQTQSPEFQQARMVQSLCKERWLIDNRLRSIAYVELKWFPVGTVNFDDVAARSKAIDDYVIRRNSDYFRGIATTYAATKPESTSLRTEAATLIEKINAARKPQPHHFVIRRAASTK